MDFGLAEFSQSSSVHLGRQDDRDEDVAVDRTVDYAGLERRRTKRPATCGATSTSSGACSTSA